MAIQRHPAKAAKSRTIAALVTKKNIAEAIKDTATASELQAEIERVGAES
jgi:hypothetical protein